MKQKLTDHQFGSLGWKFELIILPTRLAFFYWKIIGYAPRLGATVHTLIFGALILAPIWYLLDRFISRDVAQVTVGLLSVAILHAIVNFWLTTPRRKR